MSRLNASLRTFRQLRWKLTFSYTAVTVGALLAGELLLVGTLMGLTIYLLGSDVVPSIVVQEVRTALAPQLTPYLEQSPPDADGIAEWLRSPRGSLETPANNQGIQIQSDDSSDLYVLDENKTLLGAWPDDQEHAEIGEPLDPRLIPGAEEIIERALNGETDNERLYARTEGRLIFAVPVMDRRNEEVLGVLVIDAEYIGSLPDAIGPLFELVGYSLLCLVISAGTIGTVFGFVTARSLTRRLKRLTEASDAWSQGEFSVYVEDRSADEIGQLAARLNRMAQQLQNLLDTRQELAVVEERNRLARDLHDSAKQQAFAASGQIGAAKALLAENPQAAASHLAEAERLINTLRKELSTLILELRPAALSNRGLAAALTEFAAEWSRQTGIEAAVRVQGERSLPLEIELTLFRIAQEALANSARHSSATRVEVWLGYENGSATLIISDNGQGFDSAAESSGFGLHSMTDRARAAGGRLEIDSRVGGGTRITAQCPTAGPALQEKLI